MLRAVLRILTGRSKTSTQTPAHPARFAPAVQPLEARDVPAGTATLGDAVLIHDSDSVDITAAVNEEDAPFARVKGQDIPIVITVNK